jgi:arginine/lysine/ornithine decarboxylase
MTVREAFYKEKTRKYLDNIEHEISGDFIIPYPPGIPIICPGELIETEHINYIKRLLDEGIEILGIENDLVTVLD